MDALIKIALEVIGTVVDSRDTLLLIGILAAGLKQVHQTGKKQSACDQIHKSMNKEIADIKNDTKEDITGVKKDVKEALDIANKANNCAIIMKSTVDKMEKGYDSLLNGKHGIINEEKIN